MAIVLLCPVLAHAERPSQLVDSHFWEQAAGFFDLTSGYVRTQWAGVLLMGACCGLLGSFLVVRRTALIGDMLSHAILPGIVLGFLWHMRKDPAALLIGAILAGLVGTALVTALGETTKLKRDATLAIVLGGFYAVGVFLLSMVQRMEAGDKSGLASFLMGSAAAISMSDIALIAFVTAASLALIVVFYKELLTTSFDPGFAIAVGMPERRLHFLLMGLLSFAVVISVQAVGVVLVSAMLIIPAATASLLTNRMTTMIVLAVAAGMLASLSGAFAAFLTFTWDRQAVTLPTGPAIILAAGGLFSVAYLVSPEHGLIVRLVRRRRQSRRIHRENVLKAIYHLLEDREFAIDRVSVTELSAKRNRSEPEARAEAEQLVRHGLAEFQDSSIALTAEGMARAKEIVRNHRLWELYLTHAASFAPDHVHDDAERIEHVLGEDVVRLLEERFGGALDPHGRTIPAAP